MTSTLRGGGWGVRQKRDVIRLGGGGGLGPISAQNCQFYNTVQKNEHNSAKGELFE